MRKNINKRISYKSLNPPPRKKGIYDSTECVFAPSNGPKNKGENVIPSDREILEKPFAADLYDDLTSVFI